MRRISTTGITRRSSATTSTAARIMPYHRHRRRGQVFFGRHADQFQSEMFLRRLMDRTRRSPLARIWRRAVVSLALRTRYSTDRHSSLPPSADGSLRSVEAAWPVAAVAVDRDLRSANDCRSSPSWPRAGQQPTRPRLFPPTQTRTSHKEPRTRSTPHTPTGGWHFPQGASHDKSIKAQKQS